MANPKWGTKQTCPKCGTRFYDLGKQPAVCVSCKAEFVPEPILKSKQPLPEPVKKPVKKVEEVDGDEADDVDIDDDIEIDDDDDDDSVGDVSIDDDDADLSEMVTNPVEDKE